MLTNLINRNIDRERTRFRAKEEKNSFECKCCNRILQMWQHSEKEENRKPEFLCKFPEGIWIFFYIRTTPRFYLIRSQYIKSYSTKIWRIGMTKEEVILTTAITLQNQYKFQRYDTGLQTNSCLPSIAYETRGRKMIEPNTADTIRTLPILVALPEITQNHKDKKNSCRKRKYVVPNK